MTADVVVTAAASLLMFGYGPLFCAVTRRRARKPAPAPVVGLTTAEWDELTALQDKARAEFESTPIYDRLVCEQMERAEGWA